LHCPVSVDRNSDAGIPCSCFTRGGVLSPMTGRTLAHYRVVCKLSGGGMSILCEAEISDLPFALPLRSFPSTYFVKVFQIRGLVAQGLKPAFSQALSGTAETVPSPKRIMGHAPGICITITRLAALLEHVRFLWNGDLIDLDIYRKTWRGFVCTIQSSGLVASCYVSRC